jgi:predicted CXXCH cytochrome family protein
MALDYALGQRHVEQYVTPSEGGREQALPVAYDIMKGEWFDLFAGESRKPEDWGHWTNRGMTANSQCFFCHTTGYEKGYDSNTDNYRTRWIELGVGCEACHGPGSGHITARAQGGKDPYADSDREPMLAACGSCHSRRIERARYTPGDAFLDAFEPEMVDSDAYYPDGQVRDELYELVSFQQSVMYAKGVRCWDCHDVHGGGTRREGNALCLGCHATSYAATTHTHHPEGNAGSTCVACHMPTTTYMQRDVRHDHSFQRPDPVATEELGVPNACARCHSDHDASWAETALATWFPNDTVRVGRRRRAAAFQAARNGSADGVPVLLETLRSNDTSPIIAASSAKLLSRFPTSSGVVEALLTAAHSDSPLIRLGAVIALAQRSPPTPNVREALVAATRDPVRTVRTAAVLGLRAAPISSLVPNDQQAVTTAWQEWQASQFVSADTPEAHYNLALVAEAQGDETDAEREYRAALRLWPTSAATAQNLGLLLARLGRSDEAEAEFQAVLRQDPIPEAAFALALLYGQQDRWKDAEEKLKLCLNIAPHYPRAAYNLALAEAKSGETTAALDDLERAAAEAETHEEAVKALIDLARSVDDRPRIERWALDAARLDRQNMRSPDVRHLLGE